MDVRPVRGEPMRCPACGGRLVEVERSDVLIDACPQCRGVWLDRGELDRLLARERQSLLVGQDEDDDFFAEMEGRRPAGRPSRSAPTAPPPPRYEDDEKYRKKKKRRGLLEDLLDFDL